MPTTVFAISIVFGADVGTGKEVYNRHCATCHGKSGKGDGPILETFVPKETAGKCKRIKKKIK